MKKLAPLFLALALSACSRFECDDRGLIKGDSPEAISRNIDLMLRREQAELSGSQWIDRDKLARAKGCPAP